jgi:hypothetical protein
MTGGRLPGRSTVPELDGAVGLPGLAPQAGTHARAATTHQRNPLSIQASLLAHDIRPSCSHPVSDGQIVEPLRLHAADADGSE